MGIMLLEQKSYFGSSHSYVFFYTIGALENLDKLSGKKNLNTSSGIGTARASIQVNRKDILKIENFADFYSISCLFT